MSGWGGMKGVVCPLLRWPGRTRSVSFPAQSTAATFTPVIPWWADFQALSLDEVNPVGLIPSFNPFEHLHMDLTSSDLLLQTNQAPPTDAKPSARFQNINTDGDRASAGFQRRRSWNYNLHVSENDSICVVTHRDSCNLRSFHVCTLLGSASGGNYGSESQNRKYSGNASQ